MVYVCQCPMCLSAMYSSGNRAMATPPSPLSSRHSSSQDSLQQALQGLHTANSMQPIGRGVNPMQQGYGVMPGSAGRGVGSREAAAAAAAAAAKKKGIKSSLGRFFSKKEKVSTVFFFIISAFEDGERIHLRVIQI